jgi:transcriptional regulator with XRE-family HTH domain
MLRARKVLSQVNMAELLDISESKYRRFESDNSFPDVLLLDKIAKTLEVHFAELLPDDMIVINNGQKGGKSTNAVTINQLSEELINQYKARISEKDNVIILLKEKIEYLENKLG